MEVEKEEEEGRRGMTLPLFFTFYNSGNILNFTSSPTYLSFLVLSSPSFTYLFIRLTIVDHLTRLVKAENKTL